MIQGDYHIQDLDIPSNSYVILQMDNVEDYVLGGIWPSDLNLYQSWTLQHDLTVYGSLTVVSGTFNENGYTVTQNP